MKRQFPYTNEFNSDFHIKEFPLKVKTIKDYKEIISFVEDEITRILQDALDHYASIWTRFKIKIQFTKESKISDHFWINLPKFHLQEKDDILDLTDHLNQNVIQRIEEFQHRGSGWVFNSMKEALLKVSKYRPLSGGTFISTPRKLMGKHAIVNVKNEDQSCFKWAILSALYPVIKNADRVSKYKDHESVINMDGIAMPTPLKKKTFLQFLRQNPSIHINVFYFDEDGSIIPFFMDPKQPQEAIDLLFIPHQGKESGHYVWIKSFSRLVRNVTKDKMMKFVCRRCFAWFTNEDRLQRHLADCNLLTNEDGIKKIIPHCKECVGFNDSCSDCRAKTALKFNNWKTKQKIPAYMVCDFEAYLKPVAENSVGLLQHHHAISFGIKVIIAPPYRHLACFEKFTKQKVIIETNDKDISKHFLETVIAVGNELYQIIMHQNEKIKWNSNDYENYLTSWTCHMCEEKIQSSDVKVADHDHLTGEYRGPAHNECNINYSLKNIKFPVLLHNYRGYDSKMILKDIGKLHPSLITKLNVIAQNSEQFKTMSFDRVQFVDSFLHLPSSLSQLVFNLAAEVQEDITKAREIFFHLSTEFHGLSDKDFRLLLRKGVFPYTWFDSPDKLTTTHLPEIKDFFNDLTKENISKEDYDHAQAIWNTWNMNTFQDYLELYLKTDVLLLADVISNYQHVSHKAYGLEPLWFLTAPSLSYNAAMKMTKISLDLLTDVDMIHFIQKAMRGGMSYIATRKSVATSDPPRSIFYTDANNLYGGAMMKSLPSGGFKWLERWQPPNLKGSFTDKLQEIGEWNTNYILEVDACFPESVHDKMKDFPFLPEAIIPPGGKYPKLINHLGCRERYVLTFEMYLLAKMEGVEFPRIHRVLQYHQSKWLAPYINLNTELRKRATNQFEQD